jgi:hypothetical protein
VQISHHDLVTDRDGEWRGGRNGRLRAAVATTIETRPSSSSRIQDPSSKRGARLTFSGITLPFVFRRAEISWGFRCDEAVPPLEIVKADCKVEARVQAHARGAGDVLFDSNGLHLRSGYQAIPSSLPGYRQAPLIEAI